MVVTCHHHGDRRAAGDRITHVDEWVHGLVRRTQPGGVVDDDHAAPGEVSGETHHPRPGGVNYRAADRIEVDTTVTWQPDVRPRREGAKHAGRTGQGDAPVRPAWKGRPGGARHRGRLGRKRGRRGREHEG